MAWKGVHYSYFERSILKGQIEIEEKELVMHCLYSAQDKDCLDWPLKERLAFKLTPVTVLQTANSRPGRHCKLVRLKGK